MAEAAMPVHDEPGVPAWKCRRCPFCQNRWSTFLKELPMRRATKAKKAATSTGRKYKPRVEWRDSPKTLSRNTMRDVVFLWDENKDGLEPAHGRDDEDG